MNPNLVALIDHYTVPVQRMGSQPWTEYRRRMIRRDRDRLLDLYVLAS